MRGPGLPDPLRKLQRAFQDRYQEIIAKCEPFIPPLDETGSDLFDHILGEVKDGFDRAQLILADAGMGKTLLCQKLAERCWENYPIIKRIPLYVHLPQVEKLGLLLEEVLQTQKKNITQDITNILSFEEGEITWISQQPLLLLLDGFDEIQEPRNLFTLNAWASLNGQRDIKVIYTCRPEALKDQNLEDLFAAPKTDAKLFDELHGKSLKTYRLNPLKDTQIQKYLKDVDQKEAGKFQYSYWIEQLPGLMKMVRTPLLLRMVVNTLPTMVEKVEKLALENKTKAIEQHLTRWFIYENLLDSWTSNEAERIKRESYFKYPGVLCGLKGVHLKLYLFSYTSNLARSLWEKNAGNFKTKLLGDEDTLNTIFMEPRIQNSKLKDPEMAKKEYEDLLRDYECDGLYSGKAFFEGKVKCDENGIWKSVISLEKQQQLSLKRLKIMRKGSLLRTLKNGYQFPHKTVLEYLTIEHIAYDLQHEFKQYAKNIGSEKGLEKINQYFLRRHPTMLHMLAEEYKNNQTFIVLLKDIVYASKEVFGIEIAASNALTILNFMGVDFSKEDFTDIQVPDADLRGARLFCCNFRQANLQNVWFDDANLHGVDFSGANLRGAQFSFLNFIRVLSPLFPVCPSGKIEGILHYQPPGSPGFWITAHPEYGIVLLSSEIQKKESRSTLFDYKLKMKKPKPTDVIGLHAHVVSKILIITTPENIQVWSLPNAKFIKIIHDTPPAITCMGGNILASANDKLLFWKFEANKTPLIISKELSESEKINKMSLSYNDKLFAMIRTKKPKTIFIRSLPAWNFLKKIKHSLPIRDLKFSSNDEVLAYSDEINIYLSNAKGERLKTYEHFSYLFLIHISKSFLISAKPNEKLGPACWNLEAPDPSPRQFQKLPSYEEMAYAVSSDEKSLAGCRRTPKFDDHIIFCALSLQFFAEQSSHKPLDNKAYVDDLDFVPPIFGNTYGDLQVFRYIRSLGSGPTFNPNQFALSCTNYQPFCGLFKPIPGTISAKAQQSLIGSTEHESKRCSDESWVVSVARKKPRFFFPDMLALHTFLIIEGVLQARRFIIRAELFKEEHQNAYIVIKSFEDFEKFEKFKQTAKEYEAQQWEINLEDGMKLIHNIRNDQCIPIKYSLLNTNKVPQSQEGIEYYNCVTWCEKQLYQIEKIKSSRPGSSWLSFLFTLPSSLTQESPRNNNNSNNDPTSSP